MAVEEDEAPGVPEWVVTFGDMMSLLLTFFIMLVSMSELKEDKLYQAVAEAMRRQFGHDTSAMSPIPGNATPGTAAFARLATMGRARRMDTMRGGAKVKAPTGSESGTPPITKPPKRTTNGGVVGFAYGSAELNEQSKLALRRIADVLAGKALQVEIRGHTSSRPLPKDGPYKDHRELSYARCQSVLELLVKLKIDHRRMLLVAAANNEPKHPNSADRELLKENDRAEVYLLDKMIDDLGRPPETGREQNIDEALRQSQSR
ncbi:MAG: OmpA family protein [Candidatus Nealsonbacteria bacterium]|nr:OmpA family protein [Candidatus Nealsonbacteria bacterium]